jgi:hypothetical protein
MDTTPIRTIPHFTVTAADGGTVDYAKDIWQRKNLVLIAVPSGGDERELSRTYASVAAEDTRLIVTSSSVAGVSPPAVVVADQWGEVAHSVSAPTLEGLPSPDEVLAWIEHVRQRCPECEGEAR